MMAESCSLASRSVTKAIVGFSSIVLLEYNTVDPSKGFSAPTLEQISSTHVKLLRYIPCDVHALCKFHALLIRLHSLLWTDFFEVVIA